MLQPKYIVTFLPLKKQLRLAKAALIIHQDMTHQVVGIKGEHMLRLPNRPWEAYFFREKVVAVWKVTGYLPFTHQM